MFKLIIKREKYQDPPLKASSEDYKDIYDKVNIFIEEDSILDVDNCSSDFDEWIIWN